MPKLVLALLSLSRRVPLKAVGQAVAVFNDESLTNFSLMRLSKDGDYLLSHLRSTIGVIGLNFSVRNGKR